MIAWRLEPLPEARTPSLSLSPLIHYRPIPFCYISNEVRFLSTLYKLLQGILSLLLRQDQDHPYPHVKVPVHLLSLYVPPLLQEIEDGMGIPSPRIERHLCPLWQDPRDVLSQPAASDVCDPLYVKALYHVKYRLDIDPGWGNQLLPYGLIQYICPVTDPESHLIKDHLP